jgi:hypothetical protein
MIVHLSDGAIAAIGTEDDAPSDEVGVDGERINIVRQPSPSIFYKNDMGAVTNGRQFRKFYEYELASGRPIGQSTMNVRFKKTDKGEIAILPRKEYEALAAKAAEADEDIGSARLVARARKEIAAGAPLIPKKIVDRIANGENALRILREWREMTQLYLSSKTDIGQGYISDLESGRRKGTTTALKKIADAMNVPLDLLV